RGSWPASPPGRRSSRRSGSRDASGAATSSPCFWTGASATSATTFSRRARRATPSEVRLARRPLLIEVIARRTTAEALAAYRDAHPAADLVEFRLDGIADLKLDRILSARVRPKVLTVRSR